MDEGHFEEIKNTITLAVLRSTLEDLDIEFLVKNVQSWGATHAFFETLSEQQMNAIYAELILIPEIMAGNTLIELADILDQKGIEYRKIDVSSWARASTFLRNLDIGTIRTINISSEIDSIKSLTTLKSLNDVVKAISLPVKVPSLSTWEKATKWMASLPKDQLTTITKEVLIATIFDRCSDFKVLKQALDQAFIIDKLPNTPKQAAELMRNEENEDLINFLDDLPLIIDDILEGLEEDTEEEEETGEVEDQGGIKERSVKENNEQFQKLVRNIRVSRRMKRDQFLSYFPNKISDIDDRIYDWAQKFHFEIDLDLLDFTNCQREEFFKELARVFEVEYHPREPDSSQSEIITVVKTEPLVKITRGFQVKGGGIEFFVRVENTTENGIFDVNVELEPPNSFDLTSSKMINMGSISPHTFQTAIFMLTCNRCTKSEIDAIVKYRDHQTKLVTKQMDSYEIESCKYISPQELSPAEFEKRFEKAPKKDWELRLKDGITQSEIFQDIQDQLSMSTVSANNYQIELAGCSKDGRDILYRGILKNVGGGMYLTSSAASENDRNIIGMVCDLVKGLQDKMDLALQKQDSANEKLDEIQALLEQNLPMIEAALTKFDDMEAYLRKHLETDWEKIKGAWIGLRDGKISKGEFAKEALKTIGKRFITLIAGRFKSIV